MSPGDNKEAKQTYITGFHYPIDNRRRLSSPQNTEAPLTPRTSALLDDDRFLSQSEYRCKKLTTVIKRQNVGHPCQIRGNLQPTPAITSRHTSQILGPLESTKQKYSYFVVDAPGQVGPTYRARYGTTYNLRDHLPPYFPDPRAPREYDIFLFCS